MVTPENQSVAEAARHGKITLALGVSDGENPDYNLAVIKVSRTCHIKQPVFYIFKMHGKMCSHLIYKGKAL